MKKMDVLIALVVVVSVVLYFLEPKDIHYGDAWPSGLKLYEGNVLAGGREGMAELEFTNNRSGVVTCNVTVEVRQLRLWTRYWNSTIMSFPPGVSRTNLSIFLPNGRNKVVVDAKC